MLCAAAVNNTVVKLRRRRPSDTFRAHQITKTTQIPTLPQVTVAEASDNEKFVQKQAMGIAIHDCRISIPRPSFRSRGQVTDQHSCVRGDDGKSRGKGRKGQQGRFRWIEGLAGCDRQQRGGNCRWYARHRAD